MNCSGFITVTFSLISFFAQVLYAAKTEDPRSSVAEILKVSPKEITLEKQRKGMTSAGNYSFEINGKKYILKTFSKKKSEEHRKKEIESVKIFSGLGLGPKFIGASEDNKLYIREFEDGGLANYESWQNPEHLKSLGVAVRKLHSYKSENFSKSMKERADKHCKRIKKKKVAVPTGFYDYYKKFTDLLESLEKKVVFCHGDLNSNNIIVTTDGKIRFIDLGNAGNANMYEELGYITFLNGINGGNLEIFLEAYFGRKPTTEEIKNVELAQKLTSFLSSLIYFDFSESKKDKDIKYEDRVKNLDKMLESKDLKSADDLIRENSCVSVKSRDKDKITQQALCFLRRSGFVDKKETLCDKTSNDASVSIVDSLKSIVGLG